MNCCEVSSSTSLPVIDHYGDTQGRLALSRNGVLTSINTNRNYGKTWTFKKRAFRRFIKRGRKTLWLRLFRKEAKECAAKFFSSSDLRAYCGISLYDKDTNPKGNVKQVGSVFYARRTPKSPWVWFLQVFALSDADGIRGADDVKIDTIVFDEYTKPAEKYRRYHGNIVTDFLDIWHSAKREHEVRCILLGNKESFNNPFFTYFGIKAPAKDWEGIRAYRHGAFVLQQINNKAKEATEFDRKTRDLLEGTTYGDYIYKDEYRTGTGLKPRKTPRGASLYVQLDYLSNPLKISVYNGSFYVNANLDLGKPVYCDRQLNRYPRENVLVKRNRRYFYGLVEALAANDVHYDSEATKEAMLPFLRWLGV